MMGSGDERGAKTGSAAGEGASGTPASETVPRNIVRVYTPRRATVSDAFNRRTVRFRGEWSVAGR